MTTTTSTAITATTPNTLWFAPGASSRVSLIALEECGVPYGMVPVAVLAGEARQPEYLALNPKGKVPLLRTPQGWLTENIAIVTYLDAMHPQACLLPAHNPWVQAQAMSLIAWCASTLHPMIYRLRMTARVCDIEASQPRVKELALGELAAQLNVAEARLAASDSPWLMSAAWCMADTYLYWVWSRAIICGIEPTQFPRIAGLVELVLARPATQRAIAREAAAAPAV